MVRPTIWDKSDIAEIKSMLASGSSKEQIAAHFITTPSNIRQVMHRNGLKTVNKQYYSMEQLVKWCKGVQGLNEFCNEALDVQLQQHQLDIAEGMINNKKVVVVAGRQSGKDFLIRVYIIWRCICFSEQKFMIISPTQAISNELHKEVMKYFKANNTLMSYIEKTLIKFTSFTNGSEIYSLSAKSQIRGYTKVTHIIVNEAYDVPDEVFEDIMPFLAALGGSIYVLSTPSNGCIGKLWEYFNDKTFKSFQYPTSINKHNSIDWYNEIKNDPSISKSKFDEDYNAIFHESTANFFIKELISACSGEYDIKDYYNSSEYYFCGIDWGANLHNSVVTIISKREEVYKIENIIIWNNMEISEQTDRIIELNKKYKFVKIMAEKNGIGQGPYSTLNKALGNTVIPFYSTQDTKTTGYINLRTLMEDGKVIIPSTHTRLQQELRVYQYKRTPNSGMKLFASGKHTDDVIDSFMLAVKSASDSGVSNVYFPENDPNVRDDDWSGDTAGEVISYGGRDAPLANYNYNYGGN